MADDVKETLKGWTQATVDAVESATKQVAEVVTGAAGTMADKYQGSGLQDKINDLGNWTIEQVERSGVTDAGKTVVEKTGDVLDTLSGQKILDQMEERNTLQDKYNDILATKLEEAFRRIDGLEKLLGKSRS